MDDELTVEEINAHFSAMDDSVNLINETITDDADALQMFGSVEEVKLIILKSN